MPTHGSVFLTVRGRDDFSSVIKRTGDAFTELAAKARTAGTIVDRALNAKGLQDPAAIGFLDRIKNSLQSGVETGDLKKVERSLSSFGRTLRENRAIFESGGISSESIDRYLGVKQFKQSAAELGQVQREYEQQIRDFGRIKRRTLDTAQPILRDIVGIPNLPSIKTDAGRALNEIVDDLFAQSRRGGRLGGPELANRNQDLWNNLLGTANLPEIRQRVATALTDSYNKAADDVQQVARRRPLLAHELRDQLRPQQFLDPGLIDEIKDVRDRLNREILRPPNNNDVNRSRNQINSDIEQSSGLTRIREIQNEIKQYRSHDPLGNVLGGSRGADLAQQATQLTDRLEELKTTARAARTHWDDLVRSGASTDATQRAANNFQFANEQVKEYSRNLQEATRHEKRFNRPEIRERAQANNLYREESLLLDGGASLFRIQAALLLNYSIMGAFFQLVSFGTRFVVDLDNAFHNLQAITRTTATEMVGLKDNLKDISELTKFTAVEVADAARIMGQAGFSTQQIRDSIEAVTLLATATGETLDKAVDIATSTLSVFNLRAVETAKVANVMTAAINESKLTMDKLALGIQYAGNLAAQSDVSLNEFTAALGAIANAGIRSGSTIGTGLRQILTTFQAPTDKFREKLEQLGLSVSDVDVRVHGLTTVLHTLRDVGFDAADAMQSMEVRAGAAFAALINNLDDMERLRQVFLLTDAASAANEVQMQSISNRLSQLQSVAGTFIDNLFAPITEIVRGAIPLFSDFLSLLNEIPGVLRVVGTAATAAFAAFIIPRLGLLISNLVSFGGAAATAAAALRGLSASTFTFGGALASLRVVAGSSLLVGGAFAAVAILGELIFSFNDAGDAADRLQSRIDASQGRLDDYTDALTAINEETRTLINRSVDLEGEQTQLTTIAIELQQRFQDLGASFNFSANSAREHIAVLDELAERMLRVRGIELQGQSQNLLEQAGTRAQELREAFVESIQNLNNQYALSASGTAGRQPVDEVSGAIRDLPEDLRNSIVPGIRGSVAELFDVLVAGFPNNLADSDRFQIGGRPTNIPNTEFLFGLLETINTAGSDVQTILRQLESDERYAPVVREIEDITKEGESLREVIQGLIATLLEYERVERQQRAGQLDIDFRNSGDTDDLRSIEGGLTDIYAGFGDDSGVQGQGARLLRLREMLDKTRIFRDNLERGLSEEDLAAFRQTDLYAEINQTLGDISRKQSDYFEGYVERLEERAEILEGYFDRHVENIRSSVGDFSTSDQIDRAFDREGGLLEARQARELLELINLHKIQQIEGTERAQNELSALTLEHLDQDKELREHYNDLSEEVLLAQLGSVSDVLEQAINNIERQTSETDDRSEIETAIQRYEIIQERLRENLIQQFEIDNDKLRSGDPDRYQRDLNVALEQFDQARADHIKGERDRIVDITREIRDRTTQNNEALIEDIREAASSSNDPQEILQNMRKVMDLANENVAAEIQNLEEELDDIEDPALRGQVRREIERLKNQTSRTIGDIFSFFMGILRDISSGFVERSRIRSDLELDLIEREAGYNPASLTDERAATLRRGRINSDIESSGLRESFAGSIVAAFNSPTVGQAVSELGNALGDIRRLSRLTEVSGREADDEIDDLRNPDSGGGASDADLEKSRELETSLQRQLRSVEEQDRAWENISHNIQSSTRFFDAQITALNEMADASERRFVFDDRIRQHQETLRGLVRGQLEEEREVSRVRADQLAQQLEILEAQKGEARARVQAAEDAFEATTDAEARAQAHDEYRQALQDEDSLLNQINDKIREKAELQNRVLAITRTVEAAAASEAATLTDALNSAWATYREEIGLSGDHLQELHDHSLQAFRDMGRAFSTFVTDVTTGTKSIGDAFRDMGLSIIESLAEMAAQYAANQLFGELLGLVLGAAGGGGVAGKGGHVGPKSNFGILGGIKDGGYIRAAMGYYVPTRDSVPALLQPGEYVLRKSAVDQIGREALDDANSRGNRKLSKSERFSYGQSEGNKIVNVYVVAPEERAQMTEHDVVVTISRDMMKGGTTKKLVKQINMGTL